MFDIPSEVDYKLEEGTVTEVDIVRNFCRVKTMSGQNLNSVKWLSQYGGSSRAGDRISPRLGDSVVISTGLGYPFILGVLPRLQNEDNTFPVPVDGGNQLIDSGSFSLASNAVIPDQNAAKDMLAGDRLITSEGGGLIGILRGGSLLLRSSRMSEIFISKWDDLVRVVSRNWEHFTDLSSDTIKNLKGRVYRYTGYANTYGDAKKENYKFNQYTGDVSLAEKAKADYVSTETPAIDDRIHKEEIKTGGGGSDKLLMYRELHLDGVHDLRVQNAGNTLYSRIRNANDSTLMKTSNGSDTTFTRIYETKDEVIITYNDVNVIKINNDQINISFGGDPVVNLNAEGIQATYGAASMILKDTQSELNYASHYVYVTPGGVIIG